MEQLREFGTCVPYEKEYVLPDGSSVPFLIGAVRLSAEPSNGRAMSWRQPSSGNYKPR